MAGTSFDERYSTGAVRAVARKTAEVFAALEGVPFLRRNDRAEFRYFRRMFLANLQKIDRRVENGQLKPWSRRDIDILCESVGLHYPPAGKAGGGKALNIGAPHCHLLSRKSLHIGLFIGSFDPFQMTHLETGLRFLAGGRRPVDLVLIIPEGAYSGLKPERSDYTYRFDILQRQIREVFFPFIVPLDIGEGQDTIDIVQRLICLFRGYSLTLTHILGSDVFPLAARWYRADLDVWEPAAKKCQVNLDFGAFVVKRKKEDDIARELRATRRLGIPVQVDSRPIGTPSSTALRELGVFTIIFPTQEVIEKLEVVFRYGMHHHWLDDQGGAEYEI